jgi:hypothetical protein
LSTLPPPIHAPFLTEEIFLTSRRSKNIPGFFRNVRTHQNTLHNLSLHNQRAQTLLILARPHVQELPSFSGPSTKRQPREFVKVSEDGAAALPKTPPLPKKIRVVEKVVKIFINHSVVVLQITESPSWIRAEWDLGSQCWTFNFFAFEEGSTLVGLGYY